MALRVLVEDRTKKAKKAKIKKAAERVLRDSGLNDVELSILITGDDEIRELNKKFREIDKPTDVLSFPMDDPVLMGDVAISMDRVAEQAPSYGASSDEEVARLLIHGILHLMGFDHELGEAEAKEMKEREVELLETLCGAGLI